MKHTLILVIITIASLLTACSYAYHEEVDPTNLGQLQDMAADTTLNTVFGQDYGQLRYKSLSDTAMSLGAQGGLANSSEEINDI